MGIKHFSEGIVDLVDMITKQVCDTITVARTHNNDCNQAENCIANIFNRC